MVLKIMEFSFAFGYLFFSLMEWRMKDIKGTQTFCVNFNQVILVLSSWLIKLFHCQFSVQVLYYSELWCRNEYNYFHITKLYTICYNSRQECDPIKLTSKNFKIDLVDNINIESLCLYINITHHFLFFILWPNQ